jgi:hypothetical protein
MPSRARRAPPPPLRPDGSLGPVVVPLKKNPAAGGAGGGVFNGRLAKEG